MGQSVTRTNQPATRRRRSALALLALALALATLAALPASALAFISTGDSGCFWQNPLPQGNDLTSVTFIDSSHGWAVGDEGTILATTTGGWAPSGPATDTTPPVTTDDAPAGWQNAPVTVHLTASDPSPGSGIAHTYYPLDGGSQTEGTSVTVAAPADHSGDGTHTIT